MHWIVEFVVRHRSIFSLMLTSMLSIWMINAPPVKQVSTVRFLSMTIFYPLQATLSQTTRFQDVFVENKRLKKEVVGLTAELAQLHEEAAENDRLRGLLNLAQDFDYDLLPVRVIAHDPSPAHKSIVINVGKSEQVKMWMPVIGEKGVVGKVVQVMNQLSLVQLIRDPSNRTGVLFRRTRTIGILETENGNDFFVRCRSHEEVAEGDSIITSGLGGIYPRGFQVGTVSSVTKSRDPLFNRAWVKLSVDFGHMEELFVMRLSPRWSAFREEFDSLELNND